MNFKKCNKCGIYHFTHEKCADEYIIYHEDYLGEDGMKVSGYSFEDAAERYAKNYNDEGNLIDDEIEIIVERDGVKKKLILK